MYDDRLEKSNVELRNIPSARTIGLSSHASSADFSDLTGRSNLEHSKNCPFLDHPTFCCMVHAAGRSGRLALPEGIARKGSNVENPRFDVSKPGMREAVGVSKRNEGRLKSVRGWKERWRTMCTLPN